MIYSASRRTDMTAFHPDAVVDRVSRSRKLDAIVLWTKDPRNLVRHPGLRAVIGRVPAVVQLTVTGLAGTAWEKQVPPWTVFLPELAELAARLPPGAIRWRFDPILPGPGVFARFCRIKEDLERTLGRLEAATVSFPDPYKHAVARAAAAGLAWPVVAPAERRTIVSRLAREFGLPLAEPGGGPIHLCCEPELLALPGTARAACIDGRLFERLYGLPLGGLEKDPGQRVACGCVKSTDIGSYAMRCGHRCLYCYANPDIGGAEAAGAVPPPE